MVSVKVSTAILCAAGLATSAHGLGIAQSASTTDEWTKYPSSYPFENENWVPEMPPGQDNDLSNIDGNPNVGGFCAQGVAYCNAYAYHPYGIPAGLGFCGKPFQRFIYILYSIPLSDVSPFNCTASAYTFQGPAVGSFGSGPSVCEPDKCCSEYYGTTHPSEAWTAVQDSWNDRYEKYYCDWYNYDMYCAILMWQIGWCLHQYNHAGGALTRTGVLPCYQGYTYFLERCKSFKQVGGKSIVQSAEIEPDAYLDTISPQQINAVMVIFWALDRVCLPASHYNPELLKEEEAGEEAAEDAEGGGDEKKADEKKDSGSSSTPSSSSSSDSAAVVGGAPFMLFASMASFFTLARFL